MTDPISLDTAVAYLKADGDDNDLITSMIAGAQGICEGYCNRKFYPDQTTADNDFAEALTDRKTALAARKTMLASIDHSDPDRVNTQRLIVDHYIEVLGRISQRINGIVIDDSINAAILITLGHLYVNREDNVATGNNVVQVPVGAQRILQPKLWIGNLIDSSPINGCDHVDYDGCGS